MPQLKPQDLVPPDVIETRAPTGGFNISQVISDVKEILQLIAQVTKQGQRQSIETSISSEPRQLPAPTPADMFRPLLDQAIQMGYGDLKVKEAIDKIPLTLKQLKEVMR